MECVGRLRNHGNTRTSKRLSHCVQFFFSRGGYVTDIPFGPFFPWTQVLVRFSAHIVPAEGGFARTHAHAQSLLSNNTLGLAPAENLDPFLRP